MNDLKATGAKYTHTPARFLFLAGGWLRLKCRYLIDDSACLDNHSAALYFDSLVIIATDVLVAQLPEELPHGGLRRSAPPASPKADVVPCLASEYDGHVHQRFDKVEFSTRVLGVVVEEGTTSMVNDGGISLFF